MKKKILIMILMLFILCSCNKKEYENGELNVLNWSSYIPQEIINDFEREYNIRVNYNTYSSNEELLAKVSSSKEGMYDLVFPSDYMVELMINQGMLEMIDINKLPNFKNINSRFLHQEFDKTNSYSLPFLAATSVIAVNRVNIKDKIYSYNDLLKSKYKNNIVLIDDQRIIIGSALLANKYDMNSIEDYQLEYAKEWLLNLNKNIKAYDSDSPKTFFITNEVDLGIVWNAEAILASYENPFIDIIYPYEGHAISLDNYCIMKNSKNQSNAYLFIDYLLRSEVSTKITNDYPYINTTIGGKNLTDEELNKVFTNGFYVKNIGNNISKYDKIWAEIK